MQWLSRSANMPLVRASDQPDSAEEHRTKRRLVRHDPGAPIRGLRSKPGYHAAEHLVKWIYLEVESPLHALEEPLDDTVAFLRSERTIEVQQHTSFTKQPERVVQPLELSLCAHLGGGSGPPCETTRAGATQHGLVVRARGAQKDLVVGG